MKVLSPILKILVVLAAAFCVYAWFDVKGRISSAEQHMADIKGQTLVEKAPEAAKINKENNQRKVKITAFEKRVKSLESDVKSASDELESERSKNVAASAEIVKNNGEIRRLNTKLASVSKLVQERDSTIESLKKEILASKELLAKQDNVDTLKDKIAELERKVAEQQKDLTAALEKAKIADMAEVVEVIETDAAGNKVKRKFVKVPYIPTGDIATVVAADAQNGVVAINKGKADGLNPLQVVVLKKEGVVVAQAQVQNVSENMSALLLDKNSALPEYVVLNAQFELAAPEIKANTAAAAEAKPEASEESSSAESTSEE